jgi:hypothetical protein
MITSLKTDIAVLEARAAVHEALLLQLAISVYRDAKDGAVRLQAIMANTTRIFTRAAREAPAGQRQQAELALQVLEQFSEQLLANVPHVSKH